MNAYEIKPIGSRKKYLRASSVIMCLYISSYLLIALDLEIGIWVGIVCSCLAIGNFLVHTVGYIKVREYRGTIAAGVFSSIPLGILGVINLVLLIQIL